MSLEQMDWLERKGVVNPSDFRLVGQDNSHVIIQHKQHGYIIKRKKDIKNIIF